MDSSPADAGLPLVPSKVGPDETGVAGPSSLAPQPLVPGKGIPGSGGSSLASMPGDGLASGIRNLLSNAVAAFPASSLTAQARIGKGFGGPQSEGKQTGRASESVRTQDVPEVNAIGRDADRPDSEAFKNSVNISPGAKIDPKPTISSIESAADDSLQYDAGDVAVIVRGESPTPKSGGGGAESVRPNYPPPGGEILQLSTARGGATKPSAIRLQTEVGSIAVPLAPVDVAPNEPWRLHKATGPEETNRGSDQSPAMISSDSLTALSTSSSGGNRPPAVTLEIGRSSSAGAVAGREAGGEAGGDDAPAAAGGQPLDGTSTSSSDGRAIESPVTSSLATNGLQAARVRNEDELIPVPQTRFYADHIDIPSPTAATNPGRSTMATQPGPATPAPGSDHLSAVESGGPDSPQPPLRSISLDFTPDGSHAVQLRMIERSGSVHVSVHTQSQEFSARIAGGVHDLVGSLASSGYEVKAAGSSTADFSADSRQSGQQGRGQDGSQSERDHSSEGGNFAEIIDTDGDANERNQ